MKKFKFKLDVLIGIRKRNEEQISLELAEQNRFIIEQQGKMLQLHEDLKLLQQTEKSKRSTENNIVSLRYSVTYRYKLKCDMLNVGKKIDTLHENMYRIQMKLVEAIKDRKAVELIRANRYTTWKKECLTQEQEFIDDIAQKKHFKQHNQL